MWFSKVSLKDYLFPAESQYYLNPASVHLNEDKEESLSCFEFPIDLVQIM